VSSAKRVASYPLAAGGKQRIHYVIQSVMLTTNACVFGSTFPVLQVSLDSRVREVINRNMQEPSSHTFDDAQLQIYTLMQRDSYPRYMNSLAYRNLLNTLSEQSPET